MEFRIGSPILMVDLKSVIGNSPGRLHTVGDGESDGRIAFGRVAEDASVDEYIAVPGFGRLVVDGLDSG